jgi:molybdenum cofactor cytidylyltransferase
MYDCVLLAAGASSRMCAPDGPAPKALLPFGGSTLVETSVVSALEAGCRVILVVGNMGAVVDAIFRADAYVPAREDGRLLVVDNPLWERGMVGSIRAALPEVEGEAFFVALADMPFIEPEHYRALAAAWKARRAEGGDGAIVAAHEGRDGHPVLLPSAWIPEILGLPDGERLRPFLSGKPLAQVETGPGALRDIDTREDYALALKACKSPEAG